MGRERSHGEDEVLIMEKYGKYAEAAYLRFTSAIAGSPY
jgi:hypothetical protein